MIPRNRIIHRNEFNLAKLPGLKCWLSGRMQGGAIGDAIPTLTDFSGNGNHATQGTGSKQATKVAGAVRSDGVDDTYVIGANVANIFASDNKTIIAVFKTNQIVSSSRFFQQRNNGAANRFALLLTTTGFYGVQYASGSGAFSITTTAAVNTTSKIVAAIRHIGLNLLVYVNNQLVGSANNASAFVAESTSNLFASAGVNSFGAFDTNDLLVCDTALPDDILSKATKQLAKLNGVSL